MGVDYAALARQHGGTVVEDDDEPDYSALRSMSPMVAHTPRGQSVDYAKLAQQHGGIAIEDEDKGTLDEELKPRLGMMPEDPRYAPDIWMNEAQTRDTAGNILGGMADYAMMASAPTMMGGAKALASGALRTRLGPTIRGAAIGGGTAVLTGGDVRHGVITGALMGAAGGSGASAKAAAETAASEAAPDAAALLKVARSGAATTAERHAARVALIKMGWVPEAEKAAESVAETAAPAVRKLAPIPPKGNVKPATIFTKPDPVQAPKPLTEMQIVTRGLQEEAAKAAGLDIGEVFGGANRTNTAKAASPGAQRVAQHKAMMAFGKQVAGRNPKVGERIWMLLDESGNPVKELTPGEAGAASRKGLKTTWVKNLWTN